MNAIIAGPQRWPGLGPGQKHGRGELLGPFEAEEWRPDSEFIARGTRPHFRRAQTKSAVKDQVYGWLMAETRPCRERQNGERYRPMRQSTFRGGLVAAEKANMAQRPTAPLTVTGHIHSCCVTSQCMEGALATCTGQTNVPALCLCRRFLTIFFF